MGTGSGQKGNSARAGQLGWPGRAAYSCGPPTSEGHNFFVRTLFQVFLDFMESTLSEDSRNIPVDSSGYWSYPKRGIRAGRVG